MLCGELQVVVRVGGGTNANTGEEKEDNCVSQGEEDRKDPWAKPWLSS